MERVEPEVVVEVAVVVVERVEEPDVAEALEELEERVLEEFEAPEVLEELEELFSFATAERNCPALRTDTPFVFDAAMVRVTRLSNDWSG